MNILIIEDDDVIRSNVEEMLTMEGYQVLTTGSGVDGVELAKTHQPNLIFCDLMMPGMTGYEVLEQLQTIPQVSDIPFVVLTARSEETTLQKALDMGASGFVTKPFQLQKIVQTVEGFRVNQ